MLQTFSAFFRETSVGVVLKIVLNFRKLGSRSTVLVKTSFDMIWASLFGADPSYLSCECDKLQQDFLDTSFEYNNSNWLNH